MWKYEPALNYWIPQADFPSTASSSAFVINGVPYVSSTNGLFYKFDDAMNSWIQKASPGTPDDGVGFSIGDFGYLGLGNVQSIYRYSTNSDSWTQETNFPGTVRTGAVASVSNNKAYLGLGTAFGNGSPLSDYWEFTPSQLIKTQEEVIAFSCKISPNPTLGKFSVSNMEVLNQFEKISMLNQNGKIVYQFRLSEGTKEFDASELSNGLYFLVLEKSNMQTYVGKIVLSK